MATASVTNTFVNGATISAASHNTNFSDLVSFLNNSVVHRDGSKAMTGALNLGGYGLTGLDWADYTPALTAASVNPTLGSGGAITGRYIKVGKLVVAKFSVLFGSSGVNPGSGNYYISLPVTAAANAAAYGACQLFDSGASTYVGVTFFQTTTTMGLWSHGSGDVVASNNPFTWAANDYINGFLAYEAAS